MINRKYFTRQTIIPFLTAFLVLTAFSFTSHKSPLRNKVPGRYIYDSEPKIDQHSIRNLRIKKNGQYLEIVKSHPMGEVLEIETIGHWPIRGDTIFLIPDKATILKSTFAYKDTNDLYRPDTLIFKNNALWSNRSYGVNYMRK